MRNFAEARAALTKFYNRPGSNTYTLERMRELMEFLGNPQDSLKIVHVAGTSGKTSTAYYASALLEATGANVGMTVSPHVDEVNERVQINHAPLPEAAFCKTLGEFMGIVAGSGLTPSYFELLVAFAYWEFARQKIDYAVIEVGLGGLLDATNVISRDDKVCIITDIGLDHTHVLGKTLAEIAAQKAGIIQPKNHVFAYSQNQEIDSVLMGAAAKKQATLHRITALKHGYYQPSLPLFQQRNLYLAEQAVDFVLVRDGRTKLSDKQIQAAVKVQIPGRMEIHRIKGKVTVFDGAHNEQKMTALTQSLRAAFPDKSVAALAAFVEAEPDRWQPALDVLVPAAKHIIVSSFNLEPDDRLKKSMDTQHLTDYLHKHGFAATQAEPNLAVACRELLERPEPVLLVTGSLYVLSEARRYLLG